MKRLISWTVAILVVFTLLVPTTTYAKYNDVSPAYEDAVQYMNSVGIHGFSKQTFGIHHPINRGDASIYIAKTLGLWNPNAPDAGFKDIPSHRRDVKVATNTLHEAGIMNGVSEGYFGYANNMTRGQLAMLLSREGAYNLSGDPKTVPFTDVPSTMKHAVAGLIDSKATNGVSNTKFGWMNSMKRGDFARMLYALRDYPVGQTPTEPSTPEEPEENEDNGDEEEPTTPPEEEEEEDNDREEEEEETPTLPSEPTEGMQEAIRLIADTPAFQWVENKHFTAVHLKKGQVFPVTKIGETHYFVAFGQTTIGIPKHTAEQIEPIKKVPFTKTKQTRLTTKRAPMYADKQKKELIGHVEKDIRLIILSSDAQFDKIQIGDRAAYVPRTHTVADSGVPVLMYHHMVKNRHLTDQKNNRMVIDVKQFEEQINYLVHNNWTPISLDTFKKWRYGSQDLPKRVVLLTFDDGILSTTRYAYPILKKHNMPAVSFIITGKVRQQAEPWNPNTLQNVGIKEMKETKDLFDYQHHSHYFHTFEIGRPGIGKMMTRSKEEIIDDLEAGKRQLAKAYDGNTKRVDTLAYPFGQYDTKVIQAARAAGMNYGFTTQPGTVLLKDHPMKLNRQGIAPEHTIKDFERKLNNTY